MKIAIILNGISLKKKRFYSVLLPAIKRVAQADVFETRTKHDAVSLAAKAVEKQYDVILAAGGDGTLNQVVNGMLSGNEAFANLPALGLIPLGSGNDFARTLNIRPEPAQLTRLLTELKPKPIDVGRIAFTGETNAPVVYFINIADCGMGPDVVMRVLDSGRALGTTLTYYGAILKTFARYNLIEVAVKAPEWEWAGKIRAVAVANGRYFGSGIGIAPDARPDDGMFTCFIAGHVSALDFMLQQGRMRSGKPAVHSEIIYREVASIEISSGEPHLFEADGELVGNLPVKIDVIPQRLHFLW